RAIRFGSFYAKIDNEHMTRPPCDVETVDPWNNHVRIRPSVWIWRAKHLQRVLFIDVERAAFCVAHERDVHVGGEAVRGRNVSAGRREIRINSGDRFAVKDM